MTSFTYTFYLEPLDPTDEGLHDFFEVTQAITTVSMQRAERLLWERLGEVGRQRYRVGGVKVEPSGVDVEASRRGRALERVTRGTR